MKRVIICVGSLLCGLAISCSSETRSKDSTVDPVSDSAVTDSGEDITPPSDALYRPKSLVLVWDGARPDAVAKANTPHLDSLIDGAWHSNRFLQSETVECYGGEWSHHA